MKRLSTSLAAIMLLFALSATSSANSKNVITNSVDTLADPPPFSPWTPAVDDALKAGFYYWYTVPEDYYNNYKSLNDEINEWWNYYGVMVDTSPGGGTLIARGYRNSSWPHDGFATVYLYAHF